jgi:xanthine dehydrogenase accessory factor
MAGDGRTLIEAGRLAGQGVPFVLVTVAATQGSSPRDVGAKMIVHADGAIIGTIGGGELEELARASAATHFVRRTSGVEHFVLGADAGQCCGGTVDLLFEFIGSPVRLVVFGAGHVAGELARCLATAPLERIIVDDRADWNTAERFAGWRRVLDYDQGTRFARQSPESTLVCVLTCSHDQDFEVLRAVLAEPPAFVGLIGSRSKRSCFFTRLSGAGIEHAVIERIACPVGLGDMGKEPGAVAVSIAGQVLLEAKKLAGR